MGQQEQRSEEREEGAMSQEMQDKGSQYTSKQYYIKTHKIMWSWEIDIAYMSLGFITNLYWFYYHFEYWSKCILFFYS